MKHESDQLQLREPNRNPASEDGRQTHFTSPCEIAARYMLAPLRFIVLGSNPLERQAAVCWLGNKLHGTESVLRS